jgi:hypothetical protein
VSDNSDTAGHSAVRCDYAGQQQELALNYQESLDAASQMTRIDGPGLDFASHSQADAANRSGAAYLSYLQHNRDHCRQQSQLFREALDEYVGIESSNATTFNRMGSDASRAEG